MTLSRTILTGLVLWFPLSSQTLPKREFRGAWVATVVNLDWPSPNSSPDNQKTSLIALLDGLHAIGINAVLFQVRPECDALYASPYEPWSYWLTGQQGRAPLPFYDPLAFAIEEAHKRGMELHAWFNPYRAERVVGAYSLALNHAAVQHPEWTFVSGTLRMLDPGNPQVRAYVKDVIADVVTRYDIDGVHFDDYFYPYEGMQSQDAASFSAYNPQGLSLGDWRRSNVNSLIKQVHDTIKVLKPYVKFGISPFGIWKNGVPAGIFGLDAYNQIYCDALGWLQAKSIDYLTPQLYWQIGGGQDYGKLMPWWADSVAVHGRHFYPGQAPYRINDNNWTFNEMPAQLKLNRANPKTHGSVFFRAGQGLTNNPKGFADSLRLNFYRYHALPPVMSWLDSLKPSAPSNLRYEQIAGTGPAVLRWDVSPPAADGDTTSSYVVYRLTSATVQQSDLNDPANIVRIEGKPYSQLGPPPPGGPYYYAVTGLDRIKNESDPTGTITIAAPGSPLLATPGDGSDDQPLTVNLSWYQDPQVATYALQVSSDSTFSAGLVSNDTSLSDTSWAVVLSAGPIRYYWRVQSSNAGGTGPWSGIRSLTGGFPAAPILSTPSHGLTNVSVNPTFIWGTSQGATTYQFQLSTTSLFTTTVVDTAGLTDSTFTAYSLQGNRNHFWRVRAVNNISEGLWSPTNGFKTESASFVESLQAVPTEFALFQNYPNPFNASTTIRFSIPYEGIASLKVYDLLGREIAVLVNAELVPGVYSARFDSGTLPSGAYIYVLTSGRNRVSKKLLLLK